MRIDHLTSNSVPTEQEKEIVMGFSAALYADSKPAFEAYYRVSMPDALIPCPVPFEKMYLTPNRHLLIIYDDQTPVGYAWYETGHYKATILNMFVSPDHRRKSHGSKLMTYIILHAKNMLFHSGNLFADVIYGSPSQPFYSMFDFKRRSRSFYTSMFREL